MDNTFARSGVARTGANTVLLYMMTSSNGNTFRVTGPMCEEFTGHQ